MRHSVRLILAAAAAPAHGAMLADDLALAQAAIVRLTGEAACAITPPARSAAPQGRP
jgi:hypothetical protein